MSRRSSRRVPKKAAVSLSAGTSTGLSSLIEGNESTIASMLSVSIPKNDTSSSATKTKLMEALTDCMAMNNLSAEALLARFFNVKMLRSYCEDRLDVSSKGNEATLAARIARAWSKPNFEPLPFKNDDGAAAESKSSSKQSDTKKKGEADDSTKKRSGEKTEDNNSKKGGDEKEESSTKKRKVWVSAETCPSLTVTAPPGQLGFTIKQYSGDFVVTDISPSCAIQPGKLRTGDVILAIDNFEITSETDDILKESDKSRDITIAARVISMNAADRPKGSLLYLKELGAPMFRIMDYSSVAEKYGEEFLEELNPPNRGRSGGSILAGALSSLSSRRK